MSKRNASRLGMFDSDGGKARKEAEQKGTEADDEDIDIELEDSIEEVAEAEDEEILDDDQDSETDDDDDELEEEDAENTDDHKDDEGEPDSEKWEEEKASLEKRNKDTQAEYTRKNQELIEANKRIAELEESEKKHKEELEDEWLNSDDVDDATKKKFLDQQKEIDDLKTKDRERDSAAAEAAFELASKPLKEKYSDFTEMVDVLKAEYSTNDKLRNAFIASDKSPEAAYKLGRKLFLSNMMAEDPLGYDKYVKKLQKTKNKEKADKKKAAIEKLDTGSSKAPTDKTPKKSAKKTRLQRIF